MGKKFTEDQVIAALLSAPTVTEAARNLGCTPRTIYNYVNEDGFAEQLEAAMELRSKMLSDLLDGATAAAIRRLYVILEADSSGLMSDVTIEDQLQAAAILLGCKSRSKAA